MKTLSYSQVVRMFMDSPHANGFCDSFAGTFGGMLLHDHEAAKFVWLSDEEHEQYQAGMAHPSISVVRAVLNQDGTIQQMPRPCREPDDLADTA